MSISNISSGAGSVAPSRAGKQGANNNNLIQDDTKGHVDDFDWSVPDHSREMYFLPGVDRLAAYLATKSEQPVKVRVEAQGQFLEYVLDGKHPEKSVDVSLNGTPYQLKGSVKEDGALQFDGDGPPGKVDLTIQRRPEGDHASALISFEEGSMSLTQKMVVDPDPNSTRLAEVWGNFSCAKMHQEFLRGDDGKSWEIMGDMGNYPVFGKLTSNDDGSYQVVGSLGELDFKQTITPLPPSSK